MELTNKYQELTISKAAVEDELLTAENNLSASSDLHLDRKKALVEATAKALKNEQRRWIILLNNLCQPFVYSYA